MRKRQPPAEQASLFAVLEPRKAAQESARSKSAAAKPPGLGARKWQMPAVQGRTVAEIRLRFPKRLTPAQVARVEAELSALPKALTKLGFGSVQVEHVFVRRRRT